MTLVILAAQPDAVMWQVDTDHAVSTPMRMVAAALIDCIDDPDGLANLAGHNVDESDLNALMDAMRAADGLVRCGCGAWAKDSPLCESCLWEVHREKRIDRAADFDSNWSR